MRFLHGLVTLIASVVVILFASSWLAEKYKFGPDLNFWNQDDEATARHENFSVQVPVAAPVKLTVPVQRLVGPKWMQDDISSVLLPVIAGSPAYWGVGFTRYSTRDQQQVVDGGSCGIPTVNLLRAQSDEITRAPIFNRRLFIPTYAYFEGDSTKLLFALIVEEDTDGDNFYSCNDAARMHIVSLNDGSETILGRAFIPIDLSSIDFDWETRKFTFVEREQTSKDIIFRTIEISLTGEIISEELSRDLLNEAKAAFDRTEND